jgi:hypothetical protein
MNPKKKSQGTFFTVKKLPTMNRDKKGSAKKVETEKFLEMEIKFQGGGRKIQRQKNFEAEAKRFRGWKILRLKFFERKKKFQVWKSPRKEKRIPSLKKVSETKNFPSLK